MRPKEGFQIGQSSDMMIRWFHIFEEVGDLCIVAPKSKNEPVIPGSSTVEWAGRSRACHMITGNGECKEA